MAIFFPSRFPGNPLIAVVISVLLCIPDDANCTAAASVEDFSNLSYLASNYTMNFTDEGTTEDTLYIREFVLARDVVEREPVEIIDSYSMSDERAWCFARIHNSSEMQDVIFEWYYEDELYFELISKIGLSSNWRTYSTVSLQPGNWRVQLKTRDGDILDEIHFIVSE